MIWPFRAKLELTETLEWNTDILQARSGAEQRLALREAPARSFSLRHVLTHPEYAAGREIVREAESFSVPDWMLARTAGAASSGTSVSIPCPLIADLGLSAGDSVLCWASSSDYQAATVENIEESAVTVTTLAADFAGGVICPLVAAISEDGLSVSRAAGRYISADIEFLATKNPYLGETSYPQYLDLDVMTDVPVVGSLSESIGWQLEVFNNKLGAPVALRELGTPDNKFTLSWRKKTAAGVLSLRKWLHSRYGRQKAFWASSWANDFVLQQTIGATDETIYVQLPTGLADWYRDTFDIEILTQAGTSYYRRITTAEIDSNGDLALTFSVALGSELAAADVKRISLLRCARLDSDRVELLFKPGEGVSVTVPCIEVVEP